MSVYFNCGGTGPVGYLMCVLIVANLSVLLLFLVMKVTHMLDLRRKWQAE